MKSLVKKFWLPVLIFILVIILIFLLLNHHKKVIEQKDSVQIVVLEAHPQDAMLSLGGFLAKNEHPEKVVILSGEEEQDMTKDIQALLASYGDKTVNVYGPAIFKPGITNPDSELLHNAYMDVAQDYPNKNVNFYIYEDYPYIEQFNNSSVISLQKNLENDSGDLFTKVVIPLTASNIAEKIKNITGDSSGVKNFTETRCGVDPEVACEVVYELFRASL